MKSPKLCWADTGLALHLSAKTEPGGMHFENMAAHDLIARHAPRPAPDPVLEDDDA